MALEDLASPCQEHNWIIQNIHNGWKHLVVRGNVVSFNMLTWLYGSISLWPASSYPILLCNQIAHAGCWCLEDLRPAAHSTRSHGCGSPWRSGQHLTLWPRSCAGMAQRLELIWSAWQLGQPGELCGRGKLACGDPRMKQTISSYLRIGRGTRSFLEQL
jgi:hypothetical protein